MGPEKDGERWEYLFKLKSRPFLSVEAPRYTRCAAVLSESLARTGGYFPGPTALFTLVHRTSSQKFTTFQNVYRPGKMDQ